MKEVYLDDKTGTIYYDTDLKAIVVVSKPQEDNLLPDDVYKEFLKKYLEAFLKYKPNKALFDMRKFVFPGTDEVLDWIKENISKITFQNGLRYVAYIYPQEIITKFSLELFVEKTLTDLKEGPVRVLFDSYEDAVSWLKSKD